MEIKYCLTLSNNNMTAVIITGQWCKWLMSMLYDLINGHYNLWCHTVITHLLKVGTYLHIEYAPLR